MIFSCARARACNRPPRRCRSRGQSAKHWDRSGVCLSLDRSSSPPGPTPLFIAVTDYGDLIIVPPLVRSLRREAPGIDLTVRPLSMWPKASPSLERGDVDALIGGHLPSSARATRHLLFEEHFVCIRDAQRAGQDVPLTATTTASAARPVLVRRRRRTSGAIDTMLARHGRKRRIAVTLPHVVAVPFAVAGTTWWPPWPSASRSASQQPRPWRSFRFPMKCRLLPSNLSMHGAPWPIRRYAGSSRWLIGCVNRSDDPRVSALSSRLNGENYAASRAGTGNAVTDLIFSIANRDVTFFNATAPMSFL